MPRSSIDSSCRSSPFIGAIEAEIIGFATGTVTASGRLADARDRVAFVNITELDAGIGGVPVTLNSPLNATLKGDDVELRDLFVRVGSGRLSASGRWNTKLDGVFKAEFAGDFQDDPARQGVRRADVRRHRPADPTCSRTAHGLAPGHVVAAERHLQLGCRTHASRRLPSTRRSRANSSRCLGSPAMSRPAASLAVSRRVRCGAYAGATLSAIDGALTIDAKFTFSASLSNNGVRRGSTSAEAPPRSRTQSGRSPRTRCSLRLVGFAAEDPLLNLSLNGLVDLRVLSASSSVAFDGTANVNTLIEGTVARPLLDGRILLDNAEVAAVAEPRVVLSELTGPIVLDGQLAVFDGVRGLANGGALALDGTIAFDGMALSGGTLNIQAQGVALELPRGLRSELDALVTFRPDPKSPSITGDIRIVQSAYTETITLAALARQAALPITPSNVERLHVDRMQLNLAITTTEDIIVDNNYAGWPRRKRAVDWHGGPARHGRPHHLGEGGQVYLAGRTFRITRGDVSFTDRRHIHPEFNIVAEADLGTSTGNVTMTLTGHILSAQPSI